MWVVQIWLISVSNITFYYSFEFYCLWTLSTHIISDNIAWPQTRCVARISPREEGGGVPYFLLDRNKQWRFKLFLFILHICYLKGIEGRWRRFAPPYPPPYTRLPQAGPTPNRLKKVIAFDVTYARLHGRPRQTLHTAQAPHAIFWFAVIAFE